jgi:hypothetical protein
MGAGAKGGPGLGNQNDVGKVNRVKALVGQVL